MPPHSSGTSPLVFSNFGLPCQERKNSQCNSVFLQQEFQWVFPNHGSDQLVQNENYLALFPAISMVETHLPVLSTDWFPIHHDLYLKDNARMLLLKTNWSQLLLFFQDASGFDEYSAFPIITSTIANSQNWWMFSIWL